jgi:hypothetical protein
VTTSWLVVGLATVGAVAVKVAMDLAAKEIQGRLHGLPFLVLRLARWRLPRELRESIHDEWWVPDLHDLLDHYADLPVTRLLKGLRFSVSLLGQARRVAKSVSPSRPAWQRTADALSAMREESRRSSDNAFLLLVGMPMVMLVGTATMMVNNLAIDHGFWRGVDIAAPGIAVIVLVYGYWRLRRLVRRYVDCARAGWRSRTPVTPVEE